MSAITTEHAALALWMQLHDSAFPAGRMVHSQGLEEWLTERPGAGPDDIGRAVLGYLAEGYAPLDATFVAAAWRAGSSGPRLQELDELLESYKLFDNARIASTSAGRLLVSAAHHIDLITDCDYLDTVARGDAPGHNAVVEGAVQARLGISMHTAVLGSVRTQMASMLGAAVRLGRLGPRHSQRIQADNVTRVVELTDDACAREVDDVWSTAPTLEISGMRHEVRTARLFAT
ncbi:urease accessory protein UreF [Mycobacterium sp. smrl_JER01]|uniref:urease accessory protein UreF n=1 Tax=Mycobacterium sp. smrl_JER01 TaxID=3402633 RepID=UPI003ACE1AC0